MNTPSAPQPSPLKLHSWNVNGIRAALGKNFAEYVESEAPDILCLQETKASPEQVVLPACLSGWHAVWAAAEKKGYSGTAIFSREAPLSSRLGMSIPHHDTEGRVIAAEFPGFWLVNVYTPNSQDELRRLPYRQTWDRDFLAYLKKLEAQKPVIFCGDLNVAHTELDIARPKENRRNAGFTDEERAGFSAFAESGFVDTFRHFHPGEPGHYSWWSLRGGARQRNVGWRLDYFCASTGLMPQVKSARILASVMGSDHCPVELILDV